MILRLNSSTRCKRVESEKAYALKWRSEIHFLPKSKCLIIDVEKKDIHDSEEWDLVIPDWLINKNDDLKSLCRLIYDSNKMNKNNTTDIWKQEKSL
jgi:hypothetical protein